VDRVDLTRQHGVDRQRRWALAGAAYWQETYVVFGRLGDGRWFAERTGYLTAQQDGTAGAWVFDAGDRGRTLALQLAYRWMSGGRRWDPQPATVPPTDGLPWRRTGGRWVLDG
jgi:hypothetical protein